MITLGESHDQTISIDTISSQILRNYEELIAPPEVWIPNTEESQQSETHLEYVDSLQQSFYKQSLQARKQFIDWKAKNNPNFLTKQEKKQFGKTKMFVIEQSKLENEFDKIRFNRIISESLVKEVEKKSQYLTELPDEFRGIFPSAHSLLIRTVDSISIGANKNTTYKISVRELHRLQRLSNYETSIWRKERDEDDDFIPSTGWQDDPDYFINPLAVESRQFHVIKPVARPYNAIFKVSFFKDETLSEIVTTKTYSSSGTYSARDYSNVATFTYWLTQQGHKDFDVKILYSKWEYDIRVSEGSSPNPLQYKKVAENSSLGQKFLRKLNKNPYHEFEEFSWTYEEDGRSLTKVAYGIVTEDPIHCYWVYIDDKDVYTPFIVQSMPKGGSKLILKSRIVAPQFEYKTVVKKAKDGILDHYIVGATIRHHPYTDSKKLVSLETPLLQNNFIFLGNTFDNSLYKTRKYVHRSLASLKSIYSFNPSNFSLVSLVMCLKTKKGAVRFVRLYKTVYFPN